MPLCFSAARAGSRRRATAAPSVTQSPLLESGHESVATQRLHVCSPAPHEGWRNRCSELPPLFFFPRQWKIRVPAAQGAYTLVSAARGRVCVSPERPGPTSDRGSAHAGKSRSPPCSLKGSLQPAATSLDDKHLPRRRERERVAKATQGQPNVLGIPSRNGSERTGGGEHAGPAQAPQEKPPWPPSGPECCCQQVLHRDAPRALSRDHFTPSWGTLEGSSPHNTGKPRLTHPSE